MLNTVVCPGPAGIYCSEQIKWGRQQISLAALDITFGHCTYKKKKG